MRYGRLNPLNKRVGTDRKDDLLEDLNGCYWLPFYKTMLALFHVVSN